MTSSAGSGSGGLRWSIAGRVWLTNLILVLLMAALGMVAISRIAVLESAVNLVLSRNYRSIEAAHGMSAAIADLRTRDLSASQAQENFQRWLKVEQQNLTEPGEDRLAAQIAADGDALFGSANASPAQSSDLALRVERELAGLVALNEHAMFSADRRTVAVARRLRTEELFLVLTVVVLLGASSYLFARTLAVRPLNQLAETLRRIDDERALRAMSPPRSAELATLANELNAMVERLDRDYRLRLDELLHERSKTSAIIESVEDGLIVLDNQDAIVHINEVAGAILDLEPQSVVGHKLDELAAQNAHVARVIAVRRHEANQRGENQLTASPEERTNGFAPAEFKVFVRGRDHTYLAGELSWTGPGGDRLGTIVLLRDVTFVRDQERARTNLIATLSHELKTPLTSLAIGAELLAEAAVAETGARQREILTVIRDDVGRLQTIASGLLDASRNSNARIGVERRPILLDRIVREVCAPFKMQADEKRIELAVSGDQQPVPIWGDPIKLPWVITNLLGNALRYTPEHGRIAVEIRCEAKTARVIVSDTGPGIDEAVLPRIFEPYAQFPNEPARAGSAGLGLYIAKEIVEAHNGRIFADSRRGAGSSFTVEIPIREEVIG
jgi:NtrC-family two-component system sensor histidine kinase KinB